MIRLRPKGKKGQRSFAIIVNEKAQDVYGKYLEQVGVYDPSTKPPRVELKVERVKHWLDRGAQPSATVHNILVDQKILTSEKRHTGAWPKKEEPKAEEAKPAEAAPAADAVAAPKAEEPAAAPTETPTA